MPTGVAPIDTVAMAGARKRVEHAESVPGSGATRSCLQIMCSSSHTVAVWSSCKECSLKEQLDGVVEEL